LAAPILGVSGQSRADMECRRAAFEESFQALPAHSIMANTYPESGARLRKRQLGSRPGAFSSPRPAAAGIPKSLARLAPQPAARIARIELCRPFLARDKAGLSFHPEARPSTWAVDFAASNRESACRQIELRKAGIRVHSRRAPASRGIYSNA